jgi:hypothetical protein
MPSALTNPPALLNCSERSRTHAPAATIEHRDMVAAAAGFEELPGGAHLHELQRVLLHLFDEMVELDGP